MLVLTALQLTYKNCTLPFFFLLLIVKLFEILPKHNGYGFISESFALNLYIFTFLTYKKLLLPLYYRLNTIFFPDCVKLTGYLASVVNVVSSTSYVGSSPRTNTFLSLLSTCTKELIPASKIIIFLLQLPSDHLHRIHYHNHYI